MVINFADLVFDKMSLSNFILFLFEELMLLGFISLLLTVGQSPISNICIPKKIGATWHPCSKKQEEKLNSGYPGKKGEDSSSSAEDHGRKLLAAAESSRRILAGADGSDKCAAKVSNHLKTLFDYYSPKQNCVHFWCFRVNDIGIKFRGSLEKLFVTVKLYNL